MAVGVVARRPVDAGLHSSAREEPARRDRAKPRQGGHRGPAGRRRARESQAVARQWRTRDPHEPGACRAHRVQGPAGLRAHRRHAASVGLEHHERRADRHREQQLLRACSPAAGSARWRITGPWTFVAANALPAGLRAHSARLARRRRPADGRGHAAGAGRGDRELDSADGDRAAQGRTDVHAQLRRSAAVPPIPGTALSYIANSSEPIIQVGAERVLRGRRRRVVHRGASDRSVDDRDVGAGGDLHDSAVVAASTT